jgi:Integrase core domain
MDVGERSDRLRFLVRDRDAKFTAVFDAVFDAVFVAAGVDVLTTPVRAPRANAYAERWVGTVRRELLDRMLIFGRRHLELVLTEYVDHYNAHRPHRSLRQAPPVGPAQRTRIGDPVRTILRRHRLGPTWAQFLRTQAAGVPRCSRLHHRRRKRTLTPNAAYEPCGASAWTGP